MPVRYYNPIGLAICAGALALGMDWSHFNRHDWQMALLGWLSALAVAAFFNALRDMRPHD